MIKWRRFCSTFLSFSIFFSHCAFADAPQSNFWAERHRARFPQTSNHQPSQLALLARSPTSLSPDSFRFFEAESTAVSNSISWEITGKISRSSRLNQILSSLRYKDGTVRQISSSDSAVDSPIVVYIQDLHANLEAQSAISSVIQNLSVKQQLDLVSVEGAFSNIDVSPYHGLPTLVARDVAELLLRQGRISGAVHAGLLGVRAPIVGVDDLQHYKANVHAYRVSMPRASEALAHLAKRATKINKEKQKILNANLLAFDQIAESYRGGQLSLGDYLLELTGRAKDIQISLDVSNFIKAWKIEKSINDASLNGQLKRLTANLVERLGPAETEALFQQSLTVRSNETNAVDFYRMLEPLCDRKGIDLSLYPSVRDYFRYIEFIARIDGDRFFNSMQSLERKVYMALCTTPSEKDLVFESRRIAFQEKLCRFSLTPAEWKEIATDPAVEKPGWLASFGDFYREAHRRDQFLVESLNNEIKSRNARVIVLVAGGYHAEGIVRELTARNATVVSFVPRIEKPIDLESASSYLSAFDRDMTPLEQRFQGDALFLAAHPGNAYNLRLFGRAASVASGLLHGISESADRIADRFGAVEGQKVSIAPEIRANAVRVRMNVGSDPAEFSFFKDATGHLEGAEIRESRVRWIWPALQASHFQEFIGRSLSASLIHLGALRQALTKNAAPSIPWLERLRRSLRELPFTVAALVNASWFEEFILRHDNHTIEDLAIRFAGLKQIVHRTWDALILTSGVVAVFGVALLRFIDLGPSPFVFSALLTLTAGLVVLVAVTVHVNAHMEHLRLFPDVPLTIKNQPKALEELATLLASQDANIVLERDKVSGLWILRRGAILLDAPKDLTQQLGFALEAEGHKTLLIACRKQDHRSFEQAISQIFRGIQVQRAFSDTGIRSFTRYKRLLLIAPYGDQEGRPLKYATPHRGVEAVAYRVRREVEDVDALVYNPNLTNPDALYEFIRENKFDVIGFSLLQSVLRANLEILGRVSLLSPSSIFVGGGNELRKFPHAEIFSSWPLDLLVFDSGLSLVHLMRNLPDVTDKAERLAAIRETPNARIPVPKKPSPPFPGTPRVELPILESQLASVVDEEDDGDEHPHNALSSNAIAPDTELVYTPRIKEPLYIPQNLDEDIPFSDPDVVHRRAYDNSLNIIDLPIFWNVIGRRPFRIHFGNFCIGRCVYCGTRLNTQRDLSPDEVVQQMRNRPPDTDSIHFESADFLYSLDSARAVAKAITAHDDLRRLPKLVIARVDEIGDGGILFDLAAAGVQIIAYGIESFNDTVLMKIGKETTVQENIRALDLTLLAGIKAGMNLIFYTPWDTVETTMETIRRSLYYLGRGAYINVVPYISVGYGRQMTRLTDVIDFEEYDFPGLKKPFRFPRRSKIIDARLSNIAGQAMQVLHELTQRDEAPTWTGASVTLYALRVAESFLRVLVHENVPERIEAEQLLRQVHAAQDRLVLAERSSLLDAFHPDKPGAVNDRADPFNQILARITLKTEDNRTIELINTDSYPSIPPNRRLPDTLVYNIHLNANGERHYKGFVRIEVEGDSRARGYTTIRRLAEADVFITRAVDLFLQTVEESPVNALTNPAADYRVAPRQSSGFPEFPERRYRRGTAFSTAYPIVFFPLLDPERGRRNPSSEFRPQLAISDLDLTRFPSDEEAPTVMQELAEKAIQYHVAGVSVYPQHLRYLPINQLRSAGVNVGTVVAFPGGLNETNVATELKTLDAALASGANEVDFVLDVNAIRRGQVSVAQASLREFSKGARNLGTKYARTLRLKAIIETQALQSDENIRAACRAALPYVDMIKMVSGFPVAADEGRPGRATLHNARLILEEIFSNYQRTGEFKGIKFTGGISTWNDADHPDHSAKNYYQLVVDVFGPTLAYYFLFERDLVRVGGYRSLVAFLGRDDELSKDSSVMPLDPAAYPDINIPAPEDASFDIDSYVASKFPASLVASVKNEGARVEIHRGSLSATKTYVQRLVTAGAKVEPLIAPSSPHVFFRVDNRGVTTFIIGGLVGAARELFVVQALTQHYRLPADHIVIRAFHGETITSLLSSRLGAYAGHISDAVLLHNIDAFLAHVGPPMNLEVLERIKDDYIDAAVMRTPKGKVALLFDMQFANGSHAEVVVDYLASSGNGLGIKQITLFGACGAVGHGLRLNDVVLYSSLIWKGVSQTDLPANAATASQLAGFFPESVQVRTLPVHNIPTVLNGAKSYMESVLQQGGGAVELELVHAARAAKRHGAALRGIYEIHDRPILGESSKDALSEEVPGFRDFEKHHAVWSGVGRYLFDDAEPKQSARQRADVENDWSAVSHRLVKSARQVLVSKSPIIFLGGPEGRKLADVLSQAFTTEAPILYLNMLDHLSDFERTGRVEPFLPSGRERPGIPPILFLDNIHVVMREARLQISFDRWLRSGVRVIGHMPLDAYQTVEAAYANSEGGDRRFDHLRFDVLPSVGSAVRDRNIVVLGATGLVGRAVMAELHRRRFTNVRGVSLQGDASSGVESLDATDKEALASVIRGADIVINAAVDLKFSAMQASGVAEAHTERVNVGIPQNLRQLEKEGKFRGTVIHLSSYYAFGHAGRVWSISQTAPLQVYGRQKQEAERVVADLPRHLIVRLGPMIGSDPRGRQKTFYRDVLRQLNDLRDGRPVSPIRATTYPVSPLISTRQAAEGIVGLLENEAQGLFQLSGQEPLNAVEQARRLAQIFNRQHGSSVESVLDIQVVDRSSSMTPDVAMRSVISPSTDETFDHFLRESQSANGQSPALHSFSFLAMTGLSYDSFGYGHGCDWSSLIAIGIVAALLTVALAIKSLIERARAQAIARSALKISEQYPAASSEKIATLIVENLAVDGYKLLSPKDRRAVMDGVVEAAAIEQGQSLAVVTNQVSRTEPGTDLYFIESLSAIGKLRAFINILRQSPRPSVLITPDIRLALLVRLVAPAAIVIRRPQSFIEDEKSGLLEIDLADLIRRDRLFSASVASGSLRIFHTAGMDLITSGLSDNHPLSLAAKTRQLLTSMLRVVSAEAVPIQELIRSLRRAMKDA